MESKPIAEIAETRLMRTPRIFQNQPLLEGNTVQLDENGSRHLSKVLRMEEGAPVILFLGGFGAFIQTYRVWRAGGGWWIWQGAGWFLLVLMLVVLAMTGPSALL